MSARLLVLLLIGIAGCWGPAGEARPPNLVLVIGDDHGYRDFGFMGSPHVRTPHLDRMAEEGTLFTHGYATASVCVPSMRSLLTGLYPYQWKARVARLRREGAKRGPHAWIAEFETLPGRLSDAGYATFQAGKYWGEHYELAGFEDGLTTEPLMGRMGGVDQEIGRTTMEPVLEFIDAHRDEPFFLWLAPILPHTPHDASEEYIEIYADRGLAPSAQAYYANITRFDDAVGELLRHLERRGLSERTLIVYLADNGWDQPPHWRRGYAFTDGHKGKLSMHDLGVRTPIVFRWPGGVPAGAVHDGLVSSVDIVPTLLDYGGAPPLPDRPGHSLRPTIEGTGDATRDMIVQWSSVERGESRAVGAPLRHGNMFALRTPKWRYIWYRKLGEDELYDMQSDPEAEHDVSDEHGFLIAMFRRRVRQWEDEMAQPFGRPPQATQRAADGGGSSSAREGSGSAAEPRASADRQLRRRRHGAGAKGSRP